MRNIILAGTTLALAMVAGGASAAGNRSDAGPAAGDIGINVPIGTATTSTDFVLNGKYFVAKDMAVLAGVGMQMIDDGAATNNKSTSIGFTGGIRKYLKTDELAPFVGGLIQYVSTKPAGTDTTLFGLGVEGGAEYFLHKQFSLEGSVFVGYTSNETKPAGAATSTKATMFGTVKSNLSVNFYF